MAFNVYRTVKVNELLELLLNDPLVYPDFEFLAYWQMQYNDMVAVVVFFAWIKIFKYIRLVMFINVNVFGYTFVW